MEIRKAYIQSCSCYSGVYSLVNTIVVFPSMDGVDVFGV